MNISAPFIRRPVATLLLTLALLVAGAAAFPQLPIAPLPQVDFPTIAVTASLPGASPETMAATVATPLERALGRIAGVTEITSRSSQNSTRVTLQFDLARNIDDCARDVQAALNAARASLPSGMPSSPRYRKLNPADAPLMIVGLSSPTLSRAQMYDVADSIVAQRLLQIEGVGDVTIGGGAQPAVRVDANPQQLNAMGRTLDDVRQALSRANVARPQGFIEGHDRLWQVASNDRLRSAADFAPLLIGYKDGTSVRLQDVARVFDGEVNERTAGFIGQQPAITMVVFRQPGANVIATVERIRAVLPQLQASIPAAIDMRVVMDRSLTIRASLAEVERSLALAVLLVILVVFLFLGSARATLAPLLTVSAALIGTLAVMHLMGFSLNNLSLMALTIATVFVVDDTIVVLENIARHIENGASPMQAALAGAREIGFTVLSMSLSLAAVLLPVFLMAGIIGRIFYEFSATLTAAIALSLLISLATTPMLAARLLRANTNTPTGARACFERALAALRRGHARTLEAALAHPRFMLGVLAAVLSATVSLYLTIPKGVLPQQDSGRLQGHISADQQSSFQSMEAKLREMLAIVDADPAVATVSGFTNSGHSNHANLFASLKPLRERRESAQEVIARLRKKLANISGARLHLFPAQDVRVGGREADAPYQYTLVSDDLAALREWTPRVQAALERLPELLDVTTDRESHSLQTTLQFDRDAMARLGITQSQVNAALGNAFSQRQVSIIHGALNQYRVVLEVAPEFRTSAQALEDVYVLGRDAQPIPLSAFASWHEEQVSHSVHHQGGFASNTISFGLPPDVPFSQAADAVQEAVAELGLPQTVRGGFEGTARAFARSMGNQPLLILAAACVIYIVLGMLYESALHPLIILSTLPSAGLGALLALVLTGSQQDAVALIGILLLIGLVMKNAIMMVDFAVTAERSLGLDATEAIRRACLLRFRPILMTTAAALLGALPLALGGGEGAELRRPLGITIVGGLLVSQLLTLYTTPIIYLYIARLRAIRWPWRAHAAAPSC